MKVDIEGAECAVLNAFMDQGMTCLPGKSETDWDPFASQIAPPSPLTSFLVHSAIIRTSFLGCLVRTLYLPQSPLTPPFAPWLSRSKNPQHQPLNREPFPSQSWLSGTTTSRQTRQCVRPRRARGYWPRSKSARMQEKGQSIGGGGGKVTVWPRSVVY